MVLVREVGLLLVAGYFSLGDIVTTLFSQLTAEEIVLYLVKLPCSAF